MRRKRQILQPSANAMRQAAYRRRHLSDGTARRLNMVCSATAKRTLARLARSNGVTQRAMIERLIVEDGRSKAKACK